MKSWLLILEYFYCPCLVKAYMLDMEIRKNYCASNKIVHLFRDMQLISLDFFFFLYQLINLNNYPFLFNLNAPLFTVLQLMPLCSHYAAASSVTVVC